MSKTYVAEKYFFNRPNMTNEEIAKILSDDISKTSIAQVEVIRSRWKVKLKKAISDHPEISNQVKKIITSSDFQQSFFGACVSINEEIIKRAPKFYDSQTIDLFKEVKQVVTGGSDA